VERLSCCDHTRRRWIRGPGLQCNTASTTSTTSTTRKPLSGNNSHVLITMQTKAIRAAASDGYIKNTLGAVGIQPGILGSTRLVDLVGTVDSKLVAAAYGMRNEAATAYLGDHVDTTRLPNP
jgi:hypothetical protein